MPAELLEDNITDDLEATSLPEEEAAPDDEVESEVEQEPENPYAGMSREDIDALIARERKDVEAKVRQSEADKAAVALKEAEAAQARAQFQRDQQAAQSIVNGDAKKALVDGLQYYLKESQKAWEQGSEAPEIDAEWIDRAVTGFRAGLQNLDTAEWVNTANAFFAETAPKGWQPPQDLVVQAAQARELYGKQGWLKAALAIAENAGIAKGAAAERERRAADDSVRALETKNGRAPGPTGAGGQAPASKNPLQVLDDDIVSEEDDRKNWAKAYPGVPYPVR